MEAGKHFDQAYAYWQKSDFENGLRECELAIRLAPDLAEAHNLRGALLEELNRREEAIAAYREATRLNPGFQEARKNLSEAETAVKLIEKTRKHHLERAYAHDEKGELIEALRECELSIQLAPDLAEAHNLRGIILDELGHKREAIAAYREALRLDPGFEEAGENLAEIEDELREKKAVPSMPQMKSGKAETTPSLIRARADQAVDDLLSIDTPENVVFDYSVAGIGSRFLAALVDSLIIVLLQIVTLLTLAFLMVTVLGQIDLDRSSLPAWLFAVLGLIAFALFWGYYIFFEVLWNGQSPGKRWVGLRVIRTDGTPITFTESVIRNLVRLIDFMPAYYGIGVVTMFINAQSRRLGDLAAGTLVVYDRPTVTLESLKAKPTWHKRTPPPTETASADLPVERLTSHDIGMAEEFLNRQHEFVGSQATRTAIARRIAQALLKRMDVDADQTGMRSNEELILQIVLLYRSQETD
jgi:uncharacterized RDD family membrane protein YckC/regulator of sirC expression with transglutaminase-like and TPR domain